MGEKVGIKKAAEITELSEWELRRGARAGIYPHIRVGGERGRIIFDIQLLEKHIQKMMENSIKVDDADSYGKLRRIDGTGR